MQSLKQPLLPLPALARRERITTRLRNGTLAPTFDLQDETGAFRSLTKLRDSGLFLLLFLGFAACATSRRDLLAYANVYDRLRALDADMAAVTADTPESHRRLRAELGLPFALLSDPDFAVSERYGVYRSDEVDKGPQPHGEPAVFILDVRGEIAYSQVLSGPKGLASPAEMALVLLYMQQHNGRYW
jgi:peroxiredoxin Q/BCP